VRGEGVARHQLQGLLVFGLGLAVTSAALAALSWISTDPSRFVEVAVLLLANLAATVLRFVLLREWVFSTRRPAQTASHRAEPDVETLP